MVGQQIRKINNLNTILQTWNANRQQIHSKTTYIAVSKIKGMYTFYTPAVSHVKKKTP